MNYKPVGFCDWFILVQLPPVMDAILADIDVDVACTHGVLELCADNPITFTPFTCPVFDGANGSFTIDGANGSFTIDGVLCVGKLPCWCLTAFVRRFVTATSRFRLGCSTGNTRRLFLGSFDRAYTTNRRNIFDFIGFRLYGNHKITGSNHFTSECESITLIECVAKRWMKELLPVYVSRTLRNC